MKKVLVAVLAVALMATAANAATLRLVWADDEMSQTKVVPPGTQATVNVYVDTILADSVGTVYFAFASNPADNLSMDHTNTMAMAGWGAGGQSGVLGGLAQFAVADPAGAGPIGGDGVSHMVGSFVVQNDNVAADDMAKNIFSNAFADQGVLAPNGAPLVWDTRYTASYSGYVSFGDWGGPTWEPDGMATGQAPDNPLILINSVPEPASIALLALGGFALLRRR